MEQKVTASIEINNIQGTNEVKSASIEGMKSNPTIKDSKVTNTPKKEKPAFPWVKLTEDGQVRKQTIVEGDGPLVKKGDKVALLYVITLEDGTEVANSFATKIPLHLIAGQEQSIPGVDMALLTMKYGDKIRLVVNYENGFGKYDNPHGFHGSNKLIPARSTLYFTEMHLMNPDLARPKTSAQWLETAEGQKNDGNSAFEKKDWDGAIKNYQKALETLESVKKNLAVPIPSDLPKESFEKREKEDNEAKIKMNNQRVTCYSNIAACYLMKKDYPKTKEFCNKALEIDPNHVKSYFRLAKVHVALIDYEAALKILLTAQKINDTKEIQKEILAVKKLTSEKAESDKKAFGGFFNKIGSEGLYEGVEPKPALWKCHVCGEEMDAVQQARHFIKKHGEPKKDSF